MHLDTWHTWTASITPFQEDGTVDLESLESLLRRQEEAQNGLVLLGSTGEGLALAKDERRAILHHACALDLNVPIIVGLDGFRLHDVKEWMSECEKLPIDGFMLVTPIYAKPGCEGQVAWFKELLNHTKKPCMIYNVPHRTGCELHLDVIKRLRDHPNFWAVKEASGSLQSFQAYMDAGENLKFFSGNDDSIPKKAHGLVSVMSNLWPNAVNTYVRDRLKNPLWKEAANLSGHLNPITAKCYLYAIGEIRSNFLKPPLTPLDGGDLSALFEIEEKLGIGKCVATAQ